MIELDERGIPPHLLPRARAWFARQMVLLERRHGPYWPANRQWLVGYLRAELRDVVAKAEAGHAV